MRDKKALSIFVVLMFTASLTVPMAPFQTSMTRGGRLSWLPGDMLPTNSTRLNDFRDGLNVRVYNESQAMDGLNLFSLTIYPNYTGRDQEGYVLITDM